MVSPLRPLAKAAADGSLITRGSGAFRQKDEMYKFDFSAKEKLNVLFSCDFEGLKYPSIWTMEHGRGRMVYLAPGHTAETFRNPGFRDLLSRSLAWSTKKL